MFQIQAQENYKVIRVNGQILNTKTNSNLQTGSIFKDNDELSFSNSSSRAAVVNSKGRYVLQANNNRNAYAKAFLTPAMSNMSSRSGAIVNQMDLEKHFSGNYLIFNIEKIKVNKDNFPMNEQKFFYIRYQYKGEKINKRLSFNADSLILNQKELMTVDGKPIPNPDITEMKLFYLDGKTSALIGDFNPVFVKDDELKEEVKIVLETIKTKSKKEKIEEILSYINDFYGKPNKENLTTWIEENFDL